MEKVNFKIEKIILIVITSILILTAFEVKAETEIDYSTSLVRYTIDGSTSNLSIDNYLNFDPGEVVTYLAPRIWFPTALEQNKTYKIEFTLGWRPSDYIGYLEDRTTAEQFRLVFGNPTFWGSIEGSALEGVIENPFNVATCSYIQQEDQTYRFDVICYIQPNVNLKYVNIRWNLVNNNSDTLLAATIRHLRYQNLIITYQPSTTDSLLNQQIIIQQETNNSINNMNNSINNMNNSINDSSIDNSFIGDTFDDLMNDYVDSSNLGSFSGFLTLPLSWIQTLLGGSTCSDIRIPLPYLDNKFLVLPCLDSFWASLGALSTLVELCWLAVVGTRIFNGLFTIVVDVKDPNNNKSMELLKSWEL